MSKVVICGRRIYGTVSKNKCICKIDGRNGCKYTVNMALSG